MDRWYTEGKEIKVPAIGGERTVATFKTPELAEEVVRQLQLMPKLLEAVLKTEAVIVGLFHRGEDDPQNWLLDGEDLRRLDRLRWMCTKCRYLYHWPKEGA